MLSSGATELDRFKAMLDRVKAEYKERPDTGGVSIDIEAGTVGPIDGYCGFGATFWFVDGNLSKVWIGE